MGFLFLVLNIGFIKLVLGCYFLGFGISFLVFVFCLRFFVELFLRFSVFCIGGLVLNFDNY